METVWTGEENTTTTEINSDVEDARKELKNTHKKPKI